MGGAVADAQVVGEALALVAPAEQAFRSRWRFSALRRADAELADAVQEQIELYHAAMLNSSADEVKEQAAAMVRGWRAACACLEAPGIADDAYLIGEASGLRVVIGDHKASLGRVQAVDGRKVIFITPDEVATMIAGQQMILAAKGAFPDAELINLYPEYEPA